MGNSITRHGLASYWWGDWGMAASRRSRDYVHLLVDGMEKRGCSVSFEAFNFSAWEVMAHDRAEALQLIEPKLSADTTLIVCQLGENIRSSQGLYEDYREMLEYIQSHAPAARIMALSPFWPMPEISAAEKRAAEICGVAFVDCSDLWGRQEWMCPDDYKVEGENGELHLVEHQGVRQHPGDRGHAEIAGRLLQVWEQLPAAGNVGNVADHQEVKHDLSQQMPLFKEAGRGDIVKILDGFRAYRAQAVAAGRFDMKAFRQQMDKVFDECGYRQRGQGKQTEILVITDSGVGDFINLSPCIREIRRIYIEAKITLVSYSRARALAEACPYIDELHLNSRSFNWEDFLAAYDWNISYASRLLRHRFDVIVQRPHGMLFMVYP